MTRMSTPAARTGSSPAAPRNGATAIASSGRMKAEPTFVAAYWWRVHPGKEDQFRAAWRRGTELIREKYGSLGSRLHREARPDGTTRFVGIAAWPARATWPAALDARMVYEEPATRRSEEHTSQLQAPMRHPSA